MTNGRWLDNPAAVCEKRGFGGGREGGFIGQWRLSASFSLI
jgi:hypothetical protein